LVGVSTLDVVHGLLLTLFVGFFVGVGGGVIDLMADGDHVGEDVAEGSAASCDAVVGVVDVPLGSVVGVDEGDVVARYCDHVNHFDCSCLSGGFGWLPDELSIAEVEQLRK
jgi:hypothetical protein